MLFDIGGLVACSSSSGLPTLVKPSLSIHNDIRDVDRGDGEGGDSGVDASDILQCFIHCDDDYYDDEYQRRAAKGKLVI